MASDKQVSLLWAVANSRGLTKPTREQTADLTTDEVNEAKAALERGEDVFGKNSFRATEPSPSRPDCDADLLVVLARLTRVLERLEARL